MESALLDQLLGTLDVRGFLVFLMVFLLITDIMKRRNPKNFPPGPWPLPFIGNVFNIDAKQPHIYMCKLAQYYGDVFSLQLGRDKTVVVNGYKLVKEALVNQADTFSGRPLTPVVYHINKGQGLALNTGYSWKQQRRFTLATLRSFGLGKRSLESQIQLEIQHLHQAMLEEQGRPFDPHLTINNAVSNVICSLLFGRRFEYSDASYQQLLRLIFEAVYLEGSIWATLYNAFPTLMNLLPGGHQLLFSDYKKVCDFLREEVSKHQQDRDPLAPRDYIDCYLEEIEKNQGDPESVFYKENLCYCMLDLFVAGTETTSTTLRWAMLYLIKYPEVREKVQAEIDRVVGQERPPSMADRAKMPYTDAVIHEVQRMGNIVPLDLIHMTTRDTMLGGYFLPKGTQVIPNLTSVLFDKSEWQTPDCFNPGHFLDEDGKFVKGDAFMPFSAGKRVCLGESLARMELFLFFTSFLQRFTFSLPDKLEPNMEGQVGLTMSPLPFTICATPR
ncbi:cytochrome P450 2J2 isoform X1 [Amia ocellicauda]|uniref:cytochrome P450 2J2 isoform X1 n=1 Tax=Amia ocellicauda TaxID=2972642 RepID=UPI003464D8DD